MTRKKQEKREYPLNERIKYLRKKRELTQEQLASKAGVTQSSLAQFESGDISPTVKTLMALANALEMSPAIFFITDEVLVFDMKRLYERYKGIKDIPDNIYRDLNTVFMFAKKIGFE